ncbi:MAG: hypothetical protein ACREQQ_17235 [Candidatus Binatia bacterium]
MSGAFERIEARIVAIGEFLETARRYRPLSDEAGRLYRAAARIGAEVRRANRASREAPQELERLERELESLLEAPARALAELIDGPRYRSLVESMAAGKEDETRRLIAEIFADVEPVSPRGILYYPLTARRGEGVLEPQAALSAATKIAEQGFEPQPGPGVGADGEVRPIRFYEGSAGVDAAVLLIVDGEAITAPAFRAPEVGELLVYTPRLAIPFEVGLRGRSPDDWLEVRAGGYPEYRERCRALLTAAGITVREV